MVTEKLTYRYDFYYMDNCITFSEKKTFLYLSHSRLMFGVVQEQFVTIVLDLQCSTEAERDLVKYALFSLVKEQLIYLSRFNFIG